MDLLTICTILCLLYSSIALSVTEINKLMTRKGTDHGEFVHIKFNKPFHPQEDDIVLTMTSQDDQMVFPLSRVKRKATDPVLLVMTTKGLVQDHFSELEVQKDFFRSSDKTAAFSIGYGREGILEIHGHLMHNNLFHSILPVHGIDKITKQTFTQGNHGNGRNYTDETDKQKSTRRRHMVTRLRHHKMTRTKIPLDFTMDALNFSDPRVRNPNPTNIQRGRYRRDHGDESSIQNLHLEYVVVADYQNYKTWYQEVKAADLTSVEKDRLTKYRMLQFYQHVAHGIDAIYESLGSKSREMELILTGVVIVNVTGHSPWTEKTKTCPHCNTVDDLKALHDFDVWRRDILSKALRHDHTALLTGYNLYFLQSQSERTVGLSYLGGLCLNGTVSIVEEKRNALTIHIAAHELGHNLGAFHDGLENTRACPKEDEYLMVPSMSGFDDAEKASNPWSFSPCSRSDIYNFLDYLDQTGRNCLINPPLLQTTIPSTKPGITYSADLQCQNQYGRQSAVCREYHKNNWASICYSLACSNPRTNECVLIFPHHVTPCGYRKWCNKGQCESSNEAPPVEELCPLGDDPHYKCDASACHEYKDPVYSNDDIVRGICCYKCASIIMGLNPINGSNNTMATEQPNGTSFSTDSMSTSYQTPPSNDTTMATKIVPTNGTTSNVAMTTDTQTRVSSYDTSASSATTMATEVVPSNVTSSNVTMTTDNPTKVLSYDTSSSSASTMATEVVPSNVTSSNVTMTTDKPTKVLSYDTSSSSATTMATKVVHSNATSSNIAVTTDISTTTSNTIFSTDLTKKDNHTLNTVLNVTSPVTESMSSPMATDDKILNTRSSTSTVYIPSDSTKSDSHSFSTQTKEKNTTDAATRFPTSSATDDVTAVPFSKETPTSAAPTPPTKLPNTAPTQDFNLTNNAWASSSSSSPLSRSTNMATLSTSDMSVNGTTDVDTNVNATTDLTNTTMTPGITPSTDKTNMSIQSTVLYVNNPSTEQRDVISLASSYKGQGHTSNVMRAFASMTIMTYISRFCIF